VSSTPRLRLDELLAEVQDRITEVMGTRDRVHALLDAVLAVGSALDLQVVLRRIVEAAMELSEAQYGALGVVGESGFLSQFLTVGIDDEQRAKIGPLPRGHGILGELIRHPTPLRLDDLSTHSSTYGFPPGHPPMKTFLGVPVRVRDEVYGNLYLTEKRGGAGFDEEDESVVLALAAAAGVAIDNARLYDEARRREGWRAAGAEVATALLSGDEPDVVLRLVAARARELSDAAFSCIALPTGEEHLVAEVVDGPVDLAGAVLPRHGTALAAVLETGEPLLVAGPDASAVLAGRPAASALLVPLGTTVGVLVVASVEGQAPLRPYLAVELRSFAAQAALALELAERRRDAEKVGLLEDRDRIGRDLHDLVIQRLFATGMRLEGIAKLVDRPELAVRLKESVDELDTTIREIRSTIYALHETPSSDSVSLRARLLEAIDAGAQVLGHTPSVQMSGLVDTTVTPEVGEDLLAVLREALSNVARHAGASAVDVVLDVSDRVRLLVSDNGVGISPNGRRSGLANLEARAAQHGGLCNVKPLPAGGTVLEWSVPLPT
jgi:signal transduction histidine kinase